MAVDEDKRSLRQPSRSSMAGYSEKSASVKQDVENALSLLGGIGRPDKLAPDETMTEHNLGRVRDSFQNKSGKITPTRTVSGSRKFMPPKIAMLVRENNNK